MQNTSTSPVTGTSHDATQDGDPQDSSDGDQSSDSPLTTYARRTSEAKGPTA